MTSNSLINVCSAHFCRRARRDCLNIPVMWIRTPAALLATRAPQRLQASCRNGGPKTTATNATCRRETYAYSAVIEVEPRLHREQYANGNALPLRSMQFAASPEKERLAVCGISLYIENVCPVYSTAPAVELILGTRSSYRGSMNAVMHGIVDTWRWLP